MVNLEAEKEELSREVGAQVSEIDLLKEEKGRLRDGQRENKKVPKAARKEFAALKTSLKTFEESEAGKNLFANACLPSLSILKKKLDQDHPDQVWDVSEMAEFVIQDMMDVEGEEKEPMTPAADAPPALEDQAPRTPEDQAPPHLEEQAPQTEDATSEAE
ncbi:unnamed protein product [Linum trigynum]|uniref:Uncharacterized protein n=1 Tax=Linum trigynum TaxID=586398 RepID=A0AAV2GA54_9ROSI